MIITEGNVGQAVMASTCIPGLFKPVELNGELLVDGGMTENVPISPLRNQTDLPVIAIDLNAVSQYKTPTNIMGILLNSFHFTLAALDKAQHDKPDLLVAPDLSKFNWYSSKQTPELIEIGYQETLKILATKGW